MGFSYNDRTVTAPISLPVANSVTAIGIQNTSGNNRIIQRLTSAGDGQIQLVNAAGQIELSANAGAGTVFGNGGTLTACAKVEIESTSKGMLFPRMTTAQKNAIGSPVSGLVVYDSTLNKLCVYGAAGWETVTSV